MVLDQMDFTAADLFGLNPGAPSAAAHGGGGDVLPPTSTMAGDQGMVPWHPDSPMFWLVLIGGATLLGILGASFDVRAGKRHASVKVGD